MEKKLTYEQEVYAWRKAHNMCGRCGHEKAEEGSVFCSKCKVEGQERARNYYRNMPADKKRELLDRKKAVRDERKAKGLCMRCGKPVYKNFVLCKEHHYKANEYRQKKKVE